MSHTMLRCVLVGLIAIFGAACGLPLDGHGGNAAGDTAPGEHPTGPGGTPGAHDAGSGVTGNNDAGASTPEAAAPDSGPQADAGDDASGADDASDASDSSDADDGGDANDGGGQGGHKDGGKGADFVFGAH
jgi:hypothetical protein